MPRLIEYPRCSIRRALQMAEAVDGLGGMATVESVQDHLGSKGGGAFKAWQSGTVKYGFLSPAKGQLKVEPLYLDYKLAYTEAQKQEAVRTAFMNAPLFAALAKRLDGQTIPPHFEKLIIREYAIPEDVASRVAGYFVEGAREAGIIGSNNIINANPSGGPSSPKDSSSNPPITPNTGSLNIGEEPDGLAAVGVVAKESSFTVRIVGFNMNTTIDIDVEDDLEILEATVKKMRRLLKEKGANELAG